MQFNLPMNINNPQMQGFSPMGNANPYAQVGVGQGQMGLFEGMAGWADQQLGLENSPLMRGAQSVGGMWDSATSEGGLLTQDSMFGGKGSTGWFAPAMQAAGGLMQGWTGMQQMDLAKKQFAFQQDAFNKNYQNQVQLTNQSMVDRQQKRAAANPESFSAPDEQWKKSNLLPTR